MAHLLIFLTSAYQQSEQIDRPVMRAIVDANPTEHVLRPMRELMLTGYDWMDDVTRAGLAQHVGCIAGALTHDGYTRCLAEAGDTDVEIIETHGVHEQAGSAVIRARMHAR